MNVQKHVAFFWDTSSTEPFGLEKSVQNLCVIYATKQCYSRKCCHDFAFDDKWGLCFVCFVFWGAAPCQTKEELICDPADVEANIPGNFRRGNAVIATRSLVTGKCWQLDLSKIWQNDKLGGGNSNILYFHPYWGRFPFWLICFKGVETTNWLKVIRNTGTKSWIRGKIPKFLFWGCENFWKKDVHHRSIHVLGGLRASWIITHPNMMFKWLETPLQMPASDAESDHFFQGFFDPASRMIQDNSGNKKHHPTWIRCIYTQRNRCA